jgi:crossover junction endodeoxyribonuclease RusA
MPSPKRDAMGRILRDANGIIYAADEQRPPKGGFYTQPGIPAPQVMTNWPPEVKVPESRLWQFHVQAPLEWRARKGTGGMYQAAKWLNANEHLNKFKRNRLVQEWRQITMERAIQMGLPRDVADKVFIEAFVHMDSDRSYDAQNLYPTAKAMIDGLVLGKGKIKGYGLLPDDSNHHVVGPLCLPGLKYQRPGVTLRIHTIPREALYPHPYRPYIDRAKDL